MNRKVLLIAGGALAAIGIALGLLLSGGPGNMTVHGNLLDTGTSDPSCDNFAVLNGTCSSTYSSDVNDGTQIVATDSAGHVVGTGALQTDQALTGGQGFSFTMAVPAGETRYGLTVGKHGTVWFSPSEMTHDPGICLGDGCSS